MRDDLDVLDQARDLLERRVADPDVDVANLYVGPTLGVRRAGRSVALVLINGKRDEAWMGGGDREAAKRRQWVSFEEGAPVRRQRHGARTRQAAVRISRRLCCRRLLRTIAGP